MADKFLGGVRPGQTDVSIAAFFRSLTDNSELTGLLATDINASYWRQGGSRVAITASDLTAVDDPHSDGGFFETDTTNMPGLYRFDVPDAAFAAGADWVVVTITATGAFVYVERFNITKEIPSLAEISSLDTIQVISEYDNVNLVQGTLASGSDPATAIKNLNFSTWYGVDADPTNGISIDINYSVGASGVTFDKIPFRAIFQGVYSGAAGQIMEVRAYNWQLNAYEKIGEIVGVTSATKDYAYDFYLAPEHTEKSAGGTVVNINLQSTYTAGTVWIDYFAIVAGKRDSAKSYINKVDSNLATISGGRIDNNSAELHLKQLTVIQNAAGADAVKFQNIATDSNGGVGLRIQSADGNALLLKSDATAGASVANIVNDGTGNGVRILTASGNGVTVQASAGHGISLTAPDGGYSGLSVNGDIGMSVSGVQYGATVSGNATGLYIGSGSGPALDILGGGDGVRVTAGDNDGSGTGVRIVAGSVAGDGVNINSANGRGIDVLSDAHAMVLTSQSQIGLWVTGQQEGIYVKSNTMEAIEAQSIGSNALRLRTTGTGDAVLIEGGTVSGDGISITTTDGDGFHVAADGANRKSVRLSTVDGDGIAIVAQGATRAGVSIASIGGHGVKIDGGTGGFSGISVYGQGEGEPAVRIANTGQGEGIKVVTAQGHALHLDSSADAAGEGLLITAGRRAMMLSAGQTFPGVYIEGGITSGDGVRITTTDGHGINILANGSSSSIHGINVDQQTGGSAVHLVSENRHALQLSSGGSSRSPLHIFGLNPAYPAVHIEQFGATGEGLKITTVDGDGIFIDAGGTGLDINAPNSDLGITGGGGGGQIYEYVGTVRQYSGPQPVFRMVDANGAPITGLVAADFTVTVYKRGQLTGVVMLDLYKAIAEDANGYYTFATNDDSIFFDVPGITKIIIESAGAQTVYLACNVVNTDGSDANLVSINGNPVTDYSAVLRLRQLDIQSPDDVGLRVRGGGFSPGVQFQGGDDGAGIEILGGAISGGGVIITTTIGNGISVNAVGRGLEIISSGPPEDGVYIQAADNGIGLRIIGGATSGQGVRITTTDGHGVHITSAGAGKVDILATKDVAITAITYNPDNTYNTITLADGRVITFTYAAGILQGVTYS